MMVAIPARLKVVFIAMPDQDVAGEEDECAPARCMRL
jgi:hypothetical protein